MPGLLDAVLNRGKVLAKHAQVSMALPFASPPGQVSRVERPYNFLTGKREEKTVTRNRAPVALDIVPAVLSTLGDIAINSMGGKSIDVPYLRQAQENVEAADSRLRAEANIGAPQDPWELGAEVIGGLLIGPFGGGKKQVAETIAKQAMKPTTNVGIKLAQKAATAVGKTALEAVVPFRQSRGILKTSAVMAPIGIGIQEGIDAVANDPEYTGIADAVKGGKKPELKDADPYDMLNPDQQAAFDQAAATGDEELMNILVGAGQAAKTQAQADEYMPETPQWMNTTAMAGSLAALAVGSFSLNKFAESLARDRAATRAAFLPPGEGTLSGETFKPKVTTTGNEYLQNTVQSDQALRQIAKTQPKQKANWLYSQLDRVSAPSINTIKRRTLMTGQFPNSSVASTHPVSVTLEAVARDLSTDEQQILIDGLLAKNALEEIKLNNGKQTMFDDPMRPETPESLKARADLIDNDPKLTVHADRVVQNFKDILDYQLEGGIISKARYDELSSKRSSYVKLKRNQTQNTSLWGQGEFKSEERLRKEAGRSTEEQGGVQKGGTADPLRELVVETNKAIQDVEVNAVKRKFFDIAVNDGTYKDFIRKLPVGEAEHTKEGLHEVFIDGVSHKYKVSDTALDRAFMFQPYTAKSALSTALNVPNTLANFFTTGAGNPVFATTSMLYDTHASIANRPKGYNSGLLNEFLLQNAPEFIREISSRIDPTVWAKAPLGAIRYGVNAMAESAAHDLTVRLTKSGDWFTDIFGQQGTKALRDVLANRYFNSYKSMGDELGVFSGHYMQGSDPASARTGMIGISNGYAVEASKRAFKAVKDGNLPLGEEIVLQAVRGSQVAAEWSKARPIARFYMGMLHAMQEGAKYSDFAANAKRVIGDDELKAIIGSQTRRVVADIGQTGAAGVTQEVTRAARYMNVAVQSMAQTARAFRDNPANFILNKSTQMAYMLGAYYMWATASTENMMEAKNMTDDERVSQVRTFAGLTSPVDQVDRLWWGPTTAVLDELVGVNQGYVNPGWAEHFKSYLEGDLQLGDEAQSSLDDSIDLAKDAAMPINIGSNAAVNAGAAFLGTDISLSRYSGITGGDGGLKELATQQTNAADDKKGKIEDEIVSAKMQKIFESVTSTGLANLVTAALDADRVYGAEENDVSRDPSPLNNRGGIDKSIEQFLSRSKDNFVKSSPLLKNGLFKDYESVQSVNDSNYRLYYKKKDGIEAATKVNNEALRARDETGVDNRTSKLRDIDFVEPQYQGTALAPIGMATRKLNKKLHDRQQELSLINEQIRNVNAKKFTNMEEKNAEINEYNRKRKDIAEDMNMDIQQTEAIIQDAIQDPTFTYQQYQQNLGRYKLQPWPPQPMQPVEPAILQQQPSPLAP